MKKKKTRGIEKQGLNPVPPPFIFKDGELRLNAAEFPVFRVEVATSGNYPVKIGLSAHV